MDHRHLPWKAITVVALVASMLSQWDEPDTFLGGFLVGIAVLAFATGCACAYRAVDRKARAHELTRLERQRANELRQHRVISAIDRELRILLAECEIIDIEFRYGRESLVAYQMLSDAWDEMNEVSVATHRAVMRARELIDSLHAKRWDNRIAKGAGYMGAELTSAGRAMRNEVLDAIEQAARRLTAAKEWVMRDA